MNMKKSTAVFGAAIIIFSMFSILAACSSTPRPLNEEEILRRLPDNVLRYELDGTARMMRANNVTIERRQTEGNRDVVYVIVEMEDSYVHRTGSYILLINHYDVGGWIIDSAQRHRDTIAYPLRPPSEERAFERALESLSRRYSPESVSLNSIDTSNLRNGQVAYTFDIQDIKTIMTFSGTVNVVFALVGSGENYRWDFSIGNEDIQMRLNESNIIGHWSDMGFTHQPAGSFVSRRGSLSMNITEITDTKIHANGIFIDLGFNNSVEPDRNHPFDGIFTYSFFDNSNGRGISMRYEGVDFTIGVSIDDHGSANARVIFRGRDFSGQFARRGD
jgi:hypothetical protein